MQAHPRDEPHPEPLSNRAFLDTPENVRLAFRLAGPGSRLGAYVLDLAARIAIFYLVASLAGLVVGTVAGEGTAAGFYLVLAFLLEWGYGAAFETWWSGQTPGKRAFGLRVIRTEGYAIGFHEAMLRNLLRAADFMPFAYAAGLATTMATPRMQRIGDLVAGTMVIRERRPKLAGDLSDLDDYPPFPMAAFESRYRPSEKTFEAIEMLYRRRLELSPARVDEIAAVLAAPLAKRLASPEERRLAEEQPGDFLFRLLRSSRAAAAASAA